MPRGFLIFLSILIPVRAAVIPNDCPVIEALTGKLLYDNRVTYMSDNFPKDYKLRVKYEEVLRCQNITTLLNKGISVKELRYLWGIVNEHVLLAIQVVLPVRHPSYSYISDLQDIFRELLDGKQEPQSDIVQGILRRLDVAQEEVKLKDVFPKALLDNGFRVLLALYQDECGLCNPRSEPGDDVCPPGAQPTPLDYQRADCQS